MSKTFNQFVNSLFYADAPEDGSLDEVIMFSGGARYGQIVILAGGAGSGKGFVGNKLIQGEIFKSLDVDAMKQRLIDIDKKKSLYPEVRGLNLRRPEDVFKLHQFVEKRGLKDKQIANIMGSMSNPETLPNLLFDVTLKNTRYINKVLPELIALGYDPKNIHLVWVLTDYAVAVERNKNRSRVVPEDVLFMTHAGAKKTMIDIIHGADDIVSSKKIDGDMYVVLNNAEEGIYYKDKDGNIPTNAKGYKLLKGNTNIKVKSRGKPISGDGDLMDKLYKWVERNAPDTGAGEIKAPQITFGRKKEAA